jgi:uncharacterized RDD family membrane protein YckC
VGDLREEGSGAPVEQAVPASAEIAGFWRRIFALMIDGALLGCVGFAIGTVAFRQVVALGQEGRLIGAAITLLYFGILNGSWGGGATLGKRMLGLRVIRRDGRTIGPFPAFLRTIIFWTPYYLNGVFIKSVHIPGVPPSPHVDMAISILLALVVFGGIVSIAYLYLFNRRTRQSLHDLVAGSFVVRTQNVSAPVRAHFWKGHLAFAALACLVAAAIPLTFIAYLSGTSLGKVLNKTSVIQAAVLAYPGADTAQVSAGTFYASSLNGPSITRTTLTVNVRMHSVPTSMEAAQDDIAGIVLKTDPSILDQQNLQIGVAYGYDLGIFRWTVASNRAGTPEEWATRIRARSAGDAA